MKIRKFKAANSTVGMQMIRQAMGDDASILACYEVADGVEFVVTGDDLSALVNAKGQPVDAATSRAAAIASAVTPADQIARRQENLRHLGLATDNGKAVSPRNQRTESLREAVGHAGEGVSALISSAGSTAAILMRNTRQANALSNDAADPSMANASVASRSKALTRSEIKPFVSASSTGVKSPSVHVKPASPHEKLTSDGQSQADMLALKQELGSIRHWLENHLRQSSLPTNAELPEPLLQWADALGLNSQWLLAKPAITQAVTAGMSPAQALAEALMHGSSSAAIPDRGVIFVVGPAGAGKTTLVNKLVMSDIRRHGHGGLTLITTDGNRLGAQEQLRAAGRVLDVPVHSAFTPDDLRDVLARVSHERLVIVDTAGLHTRQDASLKTLAMQLACAPTAEVVLALPSDADLRGLRMLMSRVAGLPISAVALTRVDMSHAMAPMLALLSDYGLPVAAINQSPRMTDGIDAALENIEIVIAQAMVHADELINAQHSNPDHATQALMA